LAEELSVPVMVCVDGFVLTHAFEAVDLPDAAQVDRFLPAFQPRQVLDPDRPLSIGAMVGPDAFTEVRYLAHTTALRANDRIPALAASLESALGRPVRAPLNPYRLAGAETVVVALGSVLGTLQDTVDELRDGGRKVGALGLTAYRPFPTAALRGALAGATRVVVLERAFTPRVGGIVAADLHAATVDLDLSLRTVVAGLGGRAVTRDSLRRMLTAAHEDGLPPLSFLDLRDDLIAPAEGGSGR